MVRSGLRHLHYLLLISLIIGGCERNKLHNRNPQTSEDENETESTEDYLSEDFGILLKKYEDPTRELWQNPDLVVEKLGDLNGKVVADIGVGTGYFTFKIANNAEKVIAIDIDNKFLEYIEERKFELGGADIVRKIETRLCHVDDPLLEEEEVDEVLIVDTYHFIEDRVNYMRKVHNGLKTGGLLLLVDYKKGVMPVGPPEEMKVDLDVAVKELQSTAYEILEIDTASLQYQYIIRAIK